MSNFYIGDPHLFHSNIIRYDNRPFRSAEIMNDVLIKNWNDRVSLEDTVYMLGDISWSPDPEINRTILKQLNGHKILIRGNHDNPMRAVKDCFDKVVDYLEIVDNGTKVIMFHYPILFWNGQFHDSVHLYAHVHNSHQWNMMEAYMKEARALQALPMRAYNVGCMLPWMDYGPRTLLQIMDTYVVEPDIDLRGDTDGKSKRNNT